MVPLTGYADKVSVEPGQAIAFKISSTAALPYRARLVRIIHGDANPAGPGYKMADVDADFTGEYPSRQQKTCPGSCGRVEPSAAFPSLPAITLSALVWPTLPRKAGQTIIAKLDAVSGLGIRSASSLMD